MTSLLANKPDPLGSVPRRNYANQQSQQQQQRQSRQRQPPTQQEPYSSESSGHAIASETPSQYSSFSSSDSDGQAAHSDSDVDEDTASDVVGVSIGPTQSRMKARATPAEEKNRILEDHGGYFTAISDTIPDTVGEDGLFVSQLTAEPESVPVGRNKLGARQEDASIAEPTTHGAGTGAPAPRVHPHAQSLPVERRTPRGPHTDGPTPASVDYQEPKDSTVANNNNNNNNNTHRSSFTRSLLKTSLPRRPRAWSGELKRLLPDLNLASFAAKRPSLPFLSGSNSQNRARSQTIAPVAPIAPLHKRNSSLLLRRTSSLDRGRQHRDQSQQSSAEAVNIVGHDSDEGHDARHIPELRSLEASFAVKHSFARRPSTAMPKRPPSIKRSSSDQSLYLRASSTASSLEQRPLYENVHSQVNSRFKAIKDSLQDSSSRLLSMPALNLQDIRNDWTSRPFFNDFGGSSTSTNDRGMKSSVHRVATPPPPPKNPQSTHPILEEAMSELTGDIVILGGYRGSILRSAKAPHRQLWVPMKVGLNLRKVDLEVGLTREDEERMEETIIPSGVLSHVGPVDVCRRLMKRLRKCENAVRGDLRVWDYGYDWRLSPDLLSKRLIEFLEGLPSNRPNSETGQRRGAYVVAHSLGGLITRHAVNQRPDLFAGVVYAGVPQHCVNILGPLRHGDDVLLSSRVLTAQVNFTFRTSYALLPEDGHCFIDKQSKEEFRVDFFDARSWAEYRLSPCITPNFPPTTSGSGSGSGGLGGFKDFALNSRKRFSLGPARTPTILYLDGHTQTTEEDLSSRNTTHSTNSLPSISPRAVFEKAEENIQLPVDGLVGPVANPRGSVGSSKASTTCTIPRAAAIEYLQRTLSEVKQFKSDLGFQPSHQSDNKYPPAAVLYGKSVPTVYGARVNSREAIKHGDAFDDLAFAAGDGVCLASAAMLPSGYRVIKDGLVKSDRGHVGLLGDLEGVGQCLRAIVHGRKEGVGMGSQV
ncbi:hypothetical protein N7478_001106 [Penicillium angulare]|uniref:uncharacterized protein n=1 Tax=Penicillium angulare TaxID=116970 RepID=UPI0025415D49|nr:uncharacterized protein N7478_001106 [Penicillium angulare]KAJ5291855.1 hypothetical protein N7478_001106 [Penicillium angulare]